MASLNLTVIVPFYQGHAALFRLIKSLPPDLPVLIVDDLSEPPLERAEWMGANVQIQRLRRKGYFAGAVNAGLEACSTDVLVLNQDTWLEERQWLDMLVQQRTRYAMIGERIRGEHPAFPYGYIHGTFLFMRRDAIQAVGLLNATDYPLWGNTAEWQWRAARKEFEILPLTEIPGFHHERRHHERFGSSIALLLEQEPEKKNLLIRTPPLVSVIVPCHNYGRYLDDCVNSLIGGPTSLGEHLGQTMQSLEIIIVDDASTDGTPEIGARLAEVWKGIRYYRLDQNVGTAQALNFGIERAVGQYITFLSADDMREPDSIEKLVRSCEANPHTFAYDDVQMFGSGKRLRTWRMQEYDFEQLLQKNHVHAGILYPRQAWVEAGGYPPQMGNGREDWAFNIALGQKGWCGIHVRSYSYLYRREGQNRSLTNTSLEHRERFLEQIRGIFPHLYEGVRPMACCGGRRMGRSQPTNRSTNAQAASQLLPGAEGMVRLEYTGAQQIATWTGHVTNAAYRFGVTKRVGWVDKRDAGEREGKGFLSLRKNGMWLFNLYIANLQPESAQLATEVQPDNSKTEDGNTPLEPALVSLVEDTIDTALGDLEADTDETDEFVADTVPDGLVQDTLVAVEVPASDVPDPSTLTFVQIEALSLTPEQWGELRTLELAGKQRRGVLAYVDKLLAA